MDASQSNDPFRGENTGEHGLAQEQEGEVVNELQFDTARWQRVGATEDQIAALQERWNGYTDDERRQEDAWMHASPDQALIDYLNPPAAAEGEGEQQSVDDQQPPEPPAGETPVADGTQVTESAQAAEATPEGQTAPEVVPPVESGQTEEPQTEEVKYTTADVPTGNAKSVTDWAGDDKERARIALDVELAKPDDDQRKGVKEHLERVLGNE